MAKKEMHLTTKALADAMMKALKWQKQGDNIHKLDAALYERSRENATAKGADEDTGATLSQGDVNAILDEQAGGKPADVDIGEQE